MHNLDTAFDGTLEAQARTSIGEVRIVRRCWQRPIDFERATRVHHLEFSLMPAANSRGSFTERWQQGRFERIGELFFIPAGESLRVKSQCKLQQSIVCTFHPEAVTALLGGPGIWSDARLRAALSIPASPIRSLLTRLREELCTPSLSHDLLLDVLTRQIVIYLARFLSSAECSSQAFVRTTDKLSLIYDRIAQPGPTATLKELAASGGMSVRHLSRVFRARHGCSIGDFIAERRIIDAKCRLAAQLPVGAVAHSLGFRHVTNFSNAFRVATGETPRQYRDRMRVLSPAPR